MKKEELEFIKEILECKNFNEIEIDKFIKETLEGKSFNEIDKVLRELFRATLPSVYTFEKENSKPGKKGRKRKSKMTDWGNLENKVYGDAFYGQNNQGHNSYLCGKLVTGIYGYDYNMAFVSKLLNEYFPLDDELTENIEEVSDKEHLLSLNFGYIDLSRIAIESMSINDLHFIERQTGLNFTMYENKLFDKQHKKDNFKHFQKIDSDTYRIHFAFTDVDIRVFKKAYLHDLHIEYTYYFKHVGQLPEETKRLVLQMFKVRNYLKSIVKMYKNEIDKVDKTIILNLPDIQVKNDDDIDKASEMIRTEFINNKFKDSQCLQTLLLFSYYDAILQRFKRAIEKNFYGALATQIKPESDKARKEREQLGNKTWKNPGLYSPVGTRDNHFIIAMYQSAYVRESLMDLIELNKENAIYWDTDSIFTIGETKGVIVGDAIGQMKQECCNADGIFVRHGAYFLFDSDGTFIEKKVSNVINKDEVTMKDIKCLQYGKSIFLKTRVKGGLIKPCELQPSFYNTRNVFIDSLDTEVYKNIYEAYKNYFKEGV